MKNLPVVLVVFLFIGGNVFGQAGQGTPSNVKQRFAELFPQATNVTWEKEKSNYEAEFKQDGVNITAVFDASGKLVEKETEIVLSEVPPGVPKYVAGQYAGYKIVKAEKVDKDGSMYYHIEIRNALQEKDLVFDSNGNFKSEDGEQKEAKDDDGDGELDD